MQRTTKRQVLATLIRAGRRDLAIVYAADDVLTRPVDSKGKLFIDGVKDYEFDPIWFQLQPGMVPMTVLEQGLQRYFRETVELTPIKKPVQKATKPGMFYFDAEIGGDAIQLEVELKFPKKRKR